jgi:hypothetical protein
LSFFYQIFSLLTFSDFKYIIDKFKALPIPAEVISVESVILKEGQEYSLTGLYISDVSTSERPPSLVIQLDAQHGSFASYDYTMQQFLSSQVGSIEDQFNINSMKLFGNPSEVNAMLTLILYRPHEYYNGKDSISISACDLEDAGTARSSVPLCGVQLLPLIITPVNNPPTWVVPGLPIVIIEGKSQTMSLSCPCHLSL